MRHALSHPPPPSPFTLAPRGAFLCRVGCPLLASPQCVQTPGCRRDTLAPSRQDPATFVVKAKALRGMGERGVWKEKASWGRRQPWQRAPQDRDGQGQGAGATTPARVAGEAATPCAHCHLLAGDTVKAMNSLTGLLRTWRDYARRTLYSRYLSVCPYRSVVLILPLLSIRGGTRILARPVLWVQ